MTATEINKTVEAIKSNPIARLSSPSPDFFIKLQKWCIFAGIALGALSSYFLGMNEESKVGLILASFGGFVGVIGTILAKLPVDSDKIATKIINNK